MPYLRIETNVPQDKVPPNFLQDLSKSLAKTIGKPESYCSVGLVTGMQLIFGGTDAPCAQLTVMSIGQLGVKENKDHAKVIFGKIQKALGLDPKRVYITFNDVSSSDVGYDGTTFHDILG